MESLLSFWNFDVPFIRISLYKAMYRDGLCHLVSNVDMKRKHIAATRVEICMKNIILDRMVERYRFSQVPDFSVVMVSGVFWVVSFDD